MFCGHRTLTATDARMHDTLWLDTPDSDRGCFDRSISKFGWRGGKNWLELCQSEVRVQYNDFCQIPETKPHFTDWDTYLVAKITHLRFGGSQVFVHGSRRLRHCRISIPQHPAGPCMQDFWPQFIPSWDYIAVKSISIRGLQFS
jgi:hypothetical protein